MQIGDTVQIKSGYTIMNVERIRDKGRVVCVWLDKRDKLHRGTFPADALRILKK